MVLEPSSISSSFDATDTRVCFDRRRAPKALAASPEQAITRSDLLEFTNFGRNDVPFKSCDTTRPIRLCVCVMYVLSQTPLVP